MTDHQHVGFRCTQSSHVVLWAPFKTCQPASTLQTSCSQFSLQLQTHRLSFCRDHRLSQCLSSTLPSVTGLCHSWMHISTSMVRLDPISTARQDSIWWLVEVCLAYCFPCLTLQCLENMHVISKQLPCIGMQCINGFLCCCLRFAAQSLTSERSLLQQSYLHWMSIVQCSTMHTCMILMQCRTYRTCSLYGYKVLKQLLIVA